MLIGISVTSVTSKRSCALDDSPSVKESETNGGLCDLAKSLNNAFLLVASCSCLKMNTGVWFGPVRFGPVRFGSVFWFRSKYRFLTFILVYYRCKFGMQVARRLPFRAVLL